MAAGGGGSAGAGGALSGWCAARPQPVLEGIAEKFRSASRHSGWVKDSAANYDFGRFGTGLEAARRLLGAKAARGEALRVLDAGCGSGGQLMDILQLAEEAGAPAYLRGVTAERVDGHCSERLRTGGRLVSLAADGPGDATVYSAESEASPAVSEVDLRVYQHFPLEDLASQTGADFVRQGQTFDLILCSWTLFHLCDPIGALLQLRRFLAPGGELLANGAYLYFGAAEGGSGCAEAGGVAALELFCAELAPHGWAWAVEGSPVRWVPEGDDPEVGDFEGGYEVCLRWTSRGRAAEEAEAKVAELCGFSGEMLDKVWQLASGPQYFVAGYSLRSGSPDARAAGFLSEID